MRDWVVMMKARSAVRLKGDAIFQVLAGPESTEPVRAVRLRNAFSKVDGALLVTGLFAEAMGEAESAVAATASLSRHCAPLLHVICTAANAAVETPATLLIYAPPTADDVGTFVEQCACSPPPPPVSVRSMTVEQLREVFEVLEAHPDQERLHRAMAHHQQAINSMVPFNRVLSAEHLYMACENLGQVVFRRLCREANMQPDGEAKHRLAIAAGFTPVGSGRQHLYNYDSYLRYQYIFEGDETLYRNLRDASDAFEHGFGGFGEIQSAAHASADDAFKHVRRAILREAGVANDSTLFEDRFDHVVEGWQPRLQIEGTYTSTRDDEWPQFYGASLFPQIETMTDDGDEGQRTFRFRFDATGASLLDGQQITPASRLWTWPKPSERTMTRTDQTEAFTPAPLEDAESRADAE